MSRPVLSTLFVLLLAMGAGTAQARVRHHHAPASVTPVEVGIIAFNDFHGSLEPPHQAVVVPDGKGGTVQVPAGGAAWFAGAVEQLRARYRHHLTVSAGDMTGASQLASSLYLDEPTIGVMNRLGVDFNAVGNHEFDRGWRELKRIQQGGCEKLTMREPCAVENPYPGARFRFLAANVIMPDGTTLFPAYGIKRFGEGANAVAVGVIGLTLKDTPTLVTPSGVEGLTFGDEADAINRAVTELEREGVDAIVVSVHQGLQTEVGYNDKSCGGVAGPLIDILKRVDPRVDHVISGHTHRAYVCDFSQIDPARQFLVTSAGYGGSLLTDITMTIDPAANEVVSVTADNRVVQSVGTDRAGNAVSPNPRYAQVAPNPEVTAYVARYVEAAREASERPVGRVSGPAEKGGSTEESALGNLIADAQLFATRDAGAQVAFMNNSGIRAPLVPGDGGLVTYGAIYSIQPFGNTLVTKTFTGAQLLALLEQQFDDEGFMQTFSASEGFAMTYDMRRPVGSRVVSASINGQPIDPASSYRVTMNSFLAAGGDSFTVFNEGTDATTGPVDLDGFEAYLTAVPIRQLPPLGRITELK